MIILSLHVCLYATPCVPSEHACLRNNCRFWHFTTSVKNASYRQHCSRFGRVLGRSRNFVCVQIRPTGIGIIRLHQIPGLHLKREELRSHHTNTLPHTYTYMQNCASLSCPQKNGIQELSAQCVFSPSGNLFASPLSLSFSLPRDRLRSQLDRKKSMHRLHTNSTEQQASGSEVKGCSVILTLLGPEKIVTISEFHNTCNRKYKV